MLKKAMSELAADVPVDLIEITTHDDALIHRFLGSPTIRINGLDVDKSSRKRTDYALTCRVYHTDEGLLGWPSKSMVTDALAEARFKEASR